MSNNFLKWSILGINAGKSKISNLLSFANSTRCSTDVQKCSITYPECPWIFNEFAVDARLGESLRNSNNY